MLCGLILYINVGTYSLKSTKNDRFLRNFCQQFYLLLGFLPKICWEGIAEKNFLYFVAMSGLGLEHLITQPTIYRTTATFTYKKALNLDFWLYLIWIIQQYSFWLQIWILFTLQIWKFKAPSKVSCVHTLLVIWSLQSILRSRFSHDLSCVCEL